VQDGQLVMAKVQRCNGTGVLLTLPDGSRGLVRLTELHDQFVHKALKGLEMGQIVRARFLESGTAEVDPENAGDGNNRSARKSGEQGAGKENQVARRMRSLTLRQSAGCHHAGAVTCVLMRVVYGTCMHCHGK
jgi:predicted RNA-binding protein with RPS1 domain